MGAIPLRQTTCLLFCLLTIMWLTSCVSSQYMALGSVTYPPRPRDYVIEVFLPVEAPVNVHQSVANSRPLAELPRHAIQVGRIDTSGAPAASWLAVINDAKKKARQLGGDGIEIKQWGHVLTGVDGYGQAYHGKSLSMIVVKYNP